MIIDECSKEKTMIKNPLGEERINKLLRSFAIPSIVSMLVGSLYNIVDQFFIGQTVGELGNAATNIAFPLSTSCTAIALLFAIQALKPSPFCLLDEIEAALDENNVGRFAKYLHKLTKNTQFIVITHRRGTMEKADRLYGITMQEKGVSTLVSVNLIDKELDD